MTVKSFFLDETEVTNAEYAEFVRATNHAPPPAAPKTERLWRDWQGPQPPAGQEQWPVRNVSVADAEAFAQWQSQRRQTVCRLPTEEEWEYAARGNEAANLYPWGQNWIEGAANVNRYKDAGDTWQPLPVRSFPQDRSAAGVFDLVGNVHEWTATKASYYTGNKKAISPAESKVNVFRGGAYSVAQEINATSRQWSPALQYPTIGFRLVCQIP